MTTKHLLLVAFHFPPLQGGSGLHRALSLVRYLPASDWQITVLTASRSAYRNVREENLDLVPDTVKVIRAPALDTTRHLSIRGSYPRLLALPDQFQSWVASGSLAGLYHCKRFPPDIILSTYPIASAHYIGSVLQRFTDAPWVVDFRDPMAQDDYPKDPRLRRLLHTLEHRWVHTATRVLVTTPGTRRLYSNRYPDIPEDRFSIIPNGYDESMFSGSLAVASAKHTTQKLLLHSGILYRNERDPTHLFEALSELQAEGIVRAGQLKVLLRGAGNIDYFRRLAADLGITSLVEFGGPIPYRAAIEEMRTADGLLILQATSCNDQIPAKVYEYLRTRLPIVALTDPSGDTGQLLSSCGVTRIAKLNDKDAIKKLVAHFAAGDHENMTADDSVDVTQFSRETVTHQVSAFLSGLCR